MKKALIITMNKYPEGDAGAIRQEAFIQLLNSCGYNTELIGLGKSTNFEMVNTCDKNSYMSMRNRKQSIMHRLFDRLLYTSRLKKKCESSNRYDVILVVTIPYRLLKYVQKYSARNNTIIIHDSVEWYSPSEFKMGKLSLSYIINNMLNQNWINRNFRVVAISTYLQDHFSKKGCRCVRIPFIKDVLSFLPEKHSNKDKIIFIYAGSIGYKDHLRNFLEAVNRLKNKKKQIRIKLFGFSKDYLLSTKNATNNLIESLGECVEIYGTVSHQVVMKNLMDADFSILFRNPKERYSKAGFPTKVVESLTCATPVLCNLSSDLGMYLEDGVNSIISPSEDTQDIYQSLCRILKLSFDERLALQKNARQCAISNFDYRKYKDVFLELIQ